MVFWGLSRSISISIAASDPIKKRGRTGGGGGRRRKEEEEEKEEEKEVGKINDRYMAV